VDLTRDTALTAWTLRTAEILTLKSDNYTESQVTKCFRKLLKCKPVFLLLFRIVGRLINGIESAVDVSSLASFKWAGS